MMLSRKQRNRICRTGFAAVSLAAVPTTTAATINADYRTVTTARTRRRSFPALRGTVVDRRDPNGCRIDGNPNRERRKIVAIAEAGATIVRRGAT